MFLEFDIVRYRKALKILSERYVNCLLLKYRVHQNIGFYSVPFFLACKRCSKKLTTNCSSSDQNEGLKEEYRTSSENTFSYQPCIPVFQERRWAVVLLNYVFFFLLLFSCFVSGRSIV